MRLQEEEGERGRGRVVCSLLEHCQPAVSQHLALRLLEHTSCLRAEGAAPPRRPPTLQPSSAGSLNMGCSLCSLQKQEEQYKLLYEVCQVTHRILACGSGQALTLLSVTSGKGTGDFCACLCWE